MRNETIRIYVDIENLQPAIDAIDAIIYNMNPLIKILVGGCDNAEGLLEKIQKQTRLNPTEFLADLQSGLISIVTMPDRFNADWNTPQSSDYDPFE